MSVRILSVDTFERGDLLGNGGFGRTYTCAEDPRYVMKALLLNRDYRNSDDKLHIILDDLCSVRSPVLARIIGLIPGDAATRRHPAIVTENFPAGSLEVLVDSNPDLAFSEKVRILFGIASAMKTLHSAGIVHGDLKPTNVLIRDNGDPIITHFGLYQLVKVSPNEPIIGTAFRAPELHTQDISVATFESDVYSFGMITYYIMAGKVPHGRYVKPLLEGMRPELPKTFPHSIRKIIQACWAHEPEQRPSFDDVIGMFVDARFRNMDFDPGTFFRFATRLEGEAIQRREIASLRREAEINREQVAQLKNAVEAQGARIEEIAESRNELPNEDLAVIMKEHENMKEEVQNVMESLEEMANAAEFVAGMARESAEMTCQMREAIERIRGTATRLEERFNGKGVKEEPKIKKEEHQKVRKGDEEEEEEEDYVVLVSGDEDVEEPQKEWKTTEVVEEEEEEQVDTEPKEEDLGREEEDVKLEPEQEQEDVERNSEPEQEEEQKEEDLVQLEPHSSGVVPTGAADLEEIDPFLRSSEEPLRSGHFLSLADLAGSSDSDGDPALVRKIPKPA